jgi:Flp pilus assembly protein TadG
MKVALASFRNCLRTLVRARSGRLPEAFACFCRERSGNVAIIFALTLIPIVGAVGSAVDYGDALKIRTRLQAAADAAAIGSVAYSSTGYNTAVAMTSNGSVPVGVTDATNIFNGEIKGMGGFTLNSLGVTVTRANGALTSNVDFNASVPTAFLGLFSIKSIPITGASTASNGFPIFMDFYLLLDNTPSMGVGATTNDINTMVNNTPDQCAFACHDTTDPNSYYNLAKRLGVTMRIDVVRTATQQLMNTASSTQTYSNQFRMAIYDFGASASNAGLTTIQTLTSNLSTAAASAGTIDLMEVAGQNQNNDQDTGYDSVLPAINNDIPSPGTGTSSSSPQKVLFFVTDGVADQYLPASCSQPTTNGRCQEPITASLCTAIKNRGVQIAVLYTTYLPLPTNAWYNQWIAPFSSQISTNMQSCASPGLYFEVSPTQGISDAMTALFEKTVEQARLTH